MSYEEVSGQNDNEDSVTIRQRVVCAREIQEKRFHDYGIRCNPNSTRPYQHVLEPLKIYLTIAQKQYEDKAFQGYYNVGPDDRDCRTTGELVTLFCRLWGEGASWKDVSEADAPHEANFLRLDTTKVKTTFSWQPRWSVEEAVEKIIEWTKVYFNKGDIPAVMDKQIAEFFS